MRFTVRPAARLSAFSALVASAAAAFLLVAPAAPASALSTAESQFVSATNAARASHGLPALRVASDLTSVARNWSATMAAKGTIWHNPNLANDVTNWQVVGENVGMGPTVSDIQTAFMNSPHHRDNILDPGYTEFGVGTVTSNGEIFVTVDFRTPMTTQPTHVSAPAPSSPKTSTPVHQTTVRRPVAHHTAPVAKALPKALKASGTVEQALNYTTALTELAS